MPGLTTTPPYPRSRFTLEEAQDRVRGDLSLRGSSYLTDADLEAWLNEAQDIFARETKWFKFATSLSTVASQAEYDFPDAAASQIIGIDWVRLDDRDLYPLPTQQRLDLRDWAWRDQEGTPTHWFLRGVSKIRLWPTPSAASSNGLDVFGTGLPPLVTHPEDPFYVPNGFDHALLAWAKHQATIKDAHGEGARRVGLHLREWEQALNRGRLAVSEANEWDQVYLGENSLRSGSGFAPGYIPYLTSIEAPP